MKSYISSFAATAACFLAAVSHVSAQCTGFGVDIGNGGEYYFNLNSGAPFSFHGGFSGCAADTCTTQLQSPAGNLVNCGSVSTSQTDYESVCPLTHSQIVAGSYLITINCPNNGVAFGRIFTVTNIQATSTLVTTEAVTGTVTPFSTVTSVSTSTATDTITLPPVTVTSPAATFGTLTIHPSTTITSTRTISHTTTTATSTSTTTTKTKFRACTTVPVKMDVLKQGALPTLARRYQPMLRRDIALAQKRGLVKRDGPDGPLTTTVTVSATPVVIIITAVPSTVTASSLTVVTTTSTVTLLVQTVFSGTVPVTFTKPTRTKNSTVRLQETFTVTTTRTHSFTITTTPAPTQTAAPMWSMVGKMRGEKGASASSPERMESGREQWPSWEGAEDH